MKRVDKGKYDVFVNRAESLFTSMEHLAEYDLDQFGSGVAVLAVHSAISFADALFVGAKGQRCNDQNHVEATRELSKLCRDWNVDGAGVSHLKWLMSRKNDFAYVEKRIDLNE